MDKKTSPILIALAVVAVLYGLQASPVHAKMYTWTDENGVTHIADDASKVPGEQEGVQEIQAETSEPAPPPPRQKLPDDPFVPYTSEPESPAPGPQPPQQQERPPRKSAAAKRVEEPRDRRTLAVIDLDVPQTLDALRVVLSDRLRSEFVDTEKFTVVERHKMNKILEEQKLSLTGLIDTSSAVRIGRMLGVRIIVAGSVAKVGTVFTVTARMISVETGEVTDSATMDCECAIEDVLITTLRNVARKLARLPAAEGYSRVHKQLPKTFELKKIVSYQLPFENSSYSDLVWTGDRMYIGTYDGNIYRINMDLGLNVEEVYPVKNKHIAAIGWDGTNIWSAHMGTGVIARHTMDRVLSVDFAFRIEGADTYPYAMVIQGKDLYTGGYFKKLIRYRIEGPTTLRKTEEIPVGEPVNALVVIDGRMFASTGWKLIEIVNKKPKALPVKFQSECVGMAYDGRYFWVLTKDELSRYEVTESNEVETGAREKSSARVDSGHRAQRPVAVAWDGEKLWAMAAMRGMPGLFTMERSVMFGFAYKFFRWQIVNNGPADLGFDYGALAWDGEHLVTSGRTSTRDGEEQSYILRLKPDRSRRTLDVVESVSVDLGLICAMTWANGSLWVASGQNTRTSGEGSMIHQLKHTDGGKWEFVRSYKYPGHRCQALAWRGNDLWSYDVFNQKFYKHRTDDNLTVVAEYAGENGPFTYFSGLAWDGKEFWTANYNTNRVSKIVFVEK